MGRGRKRRRRRRHKKAVATCTDDEHHFETVAKDSSKASPRAGGEEDGVGSGSLRLLAAYSGSSDDSDHEDIQGSLKRRNNEDALPIPSAIHDMFITGTCVGNEGEPGDKHCAEKKSVKGSLRVGGGSLGYFDADGSDSDDESLGEPDEGDAEKLVTESDEAAKSREEAAVACRGVCLTSYTCWKCSNVGHLPQDCTVRVSTGAQAQGSKVKVPKELQLLYAACREIRSKKGQRCADCGVHSNLACCLDCR